MPSAYEHISTYTVGSGGESTIAFTSIPQTYTDLLLKFSGRNSRSGADLQEFSMRFNNNTGSIYRTIWLRGTGSSASSGTFPDDSFQQLGQPGEGATASVFSNYDIYISNYTSSNNKSISVDGVTENLASNAYNYYQSGLFSSSTAISSIQILAPSYLIVQHSTFYLYGISNA